MTTALDLVKARLNRADDALDDYLSARIEAAADDLQAMGVPLDLYDTADTVFLADYVCWSYLNRDKQDGMPQWLRLMIRERWLKNRGDNGAT